MNAERRQSSPAAERNKAPILAVLQRALPPHGEALEIASGTGQHIAFFAAAMPGWTWQPSDLGRESWESITAWSKGLANVRAPVALDVTRADWPVDEVDAIFCANMLHIAPWSACAGLMRGAARHLRPQGQLVTYGPYVMTDVPLAPSNAAFDADLRSRNPAWGLRRLDDVVDAAAECGLVLRETVAMPANNHLLLFSRAVAPPA